MKELLAFLTCLFPFMGFASEPSGPPEICLTSSKKMDLQIYEFNSINEYREKIDELNEEIDSPYYWYDIIEESSAGYTFVAQAVCNHPSGIANPMHTVAKEFNNIEEAQEFITEYNSHYWSASVMHITPRQPVFPQQPKYFLQAYTVE